MDGVSSIQVGREPVCSARRHDSDLQPTPSGPPAGVRFGELLLTVAPRFCASTGLRRGYRQWRPGRDVLLIGQAVLRRHATIPSMAKRRPRSAIRPRLSPMPTTEMKQNRGIMTSVGRAGRTAGRMSLELDTPTARYVWISSRMAAHRCASVQDTAATMITAESRRAFAMITGTGSILR